MEDNSSLAKVRQFFMSPSGRLILHFVVPIIIVVTIVIIVNSNNKPSNPSIKIDNFSEVLPDAPSYTRRETEEKLYQKVASSLSEDSAIPTSGATISKDSLFSFSLPASFTAGDFVVQIDTLNLSYIVKYFYGSLEGASEIEGSVSVVIYDMDDQNYRRADPIAYLLPKDFSSSHYTLAYTLSSETKSGYSIIATLDPPESVYLEGGVSTFKASVEDDIRDLLNKNNLNPADYDIIYKYKIVR